MSQVPVHATGEASLKRPKFSAGLLLEDSDLTLAVEFTRELNQLLVRAMLGAGILCGFKVSPTLTGCCVTVSVRRGVAVDACGALVELAHDASVSFEIACEAQTRPAQFAVLINRSERACGQRDLACADEEHDGATVATRLIDGYKIAVVAWDANGAWTRKSNTPADGDCHDCCDDKAKPLLLARLDYAPGSVNVDHSVRSYVRPATAPDPIHDLALPTPPAAPAAPAPATTIT